MKSSNRKNNNFADVKIEEIKKNISPIMAKYGIERAAVFGSISRGEERANSDIDLIIKLGEQRMGLLKYMRLIDEIEKKLGQKVDLVTEDSSKFLKPHILKDLKIIYEF